MSLKLELVFISRDNAKLGFQISNVDPIAAALLRDGIEILLERKVEFQGYVDEVDGNSGAFVASLMSLLYWNCAFVSFCESVVMPAAFVLAVDLANSPFLSH